MPNEQNRVDVLERQHLRSMVLPMSASMSGTTVASV
jgi:hypothetical protein